MKQVFVLILALLSTAMADVMHSRGGQNSCNGMSCPPNTICTVMSNTVDGVQVTRTSCLSSTREVVKEQIIAEIDGMTCTISSNMVNGKLKTTKTCQDENGNVKPMTPEQEAFFVRFEEEMDDVKDALDALNDFLDQFKRGIIGHVLNMLM